MDGGMRGLFTGVGRMVGGMLGLFTGGASVVEGGTLGLLEGGWPTTSERITGPEGNVIEHVVILGMEVNIKIRRLVQRRAVRIYRNS